MEEFDAIVVGAGPGCAWVRGKKRDETHNGEWGGGDIYCAPVNGGSMLGLSASLPNSTPTYYLEYL